MPTKEEMQQYIIEQRMKSQSEPSKPSEAEMREYVMQKRMENSFPDQNGPESRKTEAGLEGFGQGASLGYLSQLQAFAKPQYEAFQSLLGLGEPVSESVRLQAEKSLGMEIPKGAQPAQIERLLKEKGFEQPEETYVQARDQFARRGKALKEQHPYIYGGAELAGTVATGMATGGGVAKTAAGRAKQAAALGGGYGALTNPGDIEGVVNELQVAPRLKNALVGTLTGFGAQKGLEKIGQYSKGLAGQIQKIARKRAARKAAEAERILQKDPTLKITEEISESGGDILKTIKKQQDRIRPTKATQQQNLAYKELGLEELTPVQMQPKVTGEPTPAQYVESLIKSKDPKMYQQQLKQSQSFDKATGKFKELGAPDLETFGGETLETIKGATKKVGAKIGEFKEKIKTQSINKDKLAFDMADAMPEASKLTKSQLGDATEYMERMFSAKNAGEIDDAMSLIGGEISESMTKSGYKGTPYTRALGKIKSAGEKYIEELIPAGKPREAYKQYTKVMKLYGDTLKGTSKTGGSAKVLKKVTSTAENFNQFKEVAETLEHPELITSVRENYLSNIFNQPQWRSTLKKAQKTKAFKEIVPNDIKKKINLLLKYDEQMASTMTKTVNPSRSGIVGAIWEGGKGNYSKAASVLFGEERKMNRAVKLYGKILKQEVKDADKGFLMKAHNRLMKIPAFTELIQKNPGGYQALLAKAASDDDIQKDKKISDKKFMGRQSWVANGLRKASDLSEKVDMKNPAIVKKLIYTQKGEELLIRAGDLKPNSDAMKKHIKKIEKYLEGNK